MEISKEEAIANIEAHIKASKKEYLKEGTLLAAADMKSRIEGLQVALDLVKHIKVPTIMEMAEELVRMKNEGKE